MWIVKVLHYTNGRELQLTSEWFMAVVDAPKLIKVQNKYFQHIYYDTNKHGTMECFYGEISFERLELQGMSIKDAVEYKIPAGDMCECGSDAVKAEYHSWYCPKASIL